MDELTRNRPDLYSLTNDELAAEYLWCENMTADANFMDVHALRGRQRAIERLLAKDWS